ncbi:MAG TPA: hypothetical protein VF173_07325 [Thermoanaerobaculia bacterium]|nr:hypothetical protein [Thermoanaerobaculia bacterium]
MFGELPKLFGRDFAIGFLLPVAFFIPCSLLVANGFSSVAIHAFLESLRGIKDQPALLGATMFVFVLWFGGVTLLALNRTIIRAKEGYGKWNPIKALAFIERRRFRRLRSRLSDLDSDYLLAEKLSLPEIQEVRNNRSNLLKRLAVRFPKEENDLLPTAFGNTIRAFERYPWIMYGADAIPLWPRMLMVVSGDVRALVDAAKSEMDFWLNLWIAGLVLLAEYLALAIYTHNRGNLWLLTSILLLLPVSSNRAKEAAAGWGEMVKATFDVHLPVLRKTLEMREKQDRTTEREDWRGLNRAFIYRDAVDLPPRDPVEESRTRSRISDTSLTRSEILK